MATKKNDKKIKVADMPVTKVARPKSKLEQQVFQDAIKQAIEHNHTLLQESTLPNHESVWACYSIDKNGHEARWPYAAGSKMEVFQVKLMMGPMMARYVLEHQTDDLMVFKDATSDCEVPAIAYFRVQYPKPDLSSILK